MSEAIVIHRQAVSEGRAAQPLVAEPPRTMARSLPRSLVLIVLVGITLRLAVAMWVHGEPLHVWDERDYDTLAVNLVRHGEYGFEPGIKTSIRPPLYPALLAAVYSVAGERNYLAVRALQAVLSGGLVVVVFFLARGMYDQRTGVVAAAICALYPSLVAASGLVLTETLFTLLLCSSCLVMHGYLTRGGVGRLVVFGILVGLAAQTRSVMWLFVPVLAVFLVAGDVQHSLPRRFVHAAVALAAMLAVMAPWAIRNTRLQETFTGIDVMGGRNFMMGNYEHTPLARPWDAISMEGEQAWHAVLQQRFPLAGRTQGQIDKLALRYGVGYVKEHPGQTLRRDIAKFFHFWQLEREIVAGLAHGFWGRLSQPWVLVAAAAILGTYVATLLSGVFGALVRMSAPGQAHVFPILVIAFVCGIHTLVFAHSRYHLPLMPLVAVYAAAAWTGAGEISQQWRRPAFWSATATCGVLTASWAWELWVESARF